MFRYLLFSLIVLCFQEVKAETKRVSAASPADTVIIKLGLTGDEISQEWKNAISPRMSVKRLDSIAALQKKITHELKDWVDLVESKKSKWNLFRDSLENAFSDCHVPDTLYVLLGLSEGNDAFTYKKNTVCFDIEALQKLYGSALLIDNDERLDRLFAHEFTHLIHKEWAGKNKLQLQSFKDSVLWECIYEGMGMYRSLSKKWLPQNGVLPDLTKDALSELYPIFVNMLTEAETSADLSAPEKSRIQENLSNGPVAKKWGAFTVAIWMALESNGDDRKLRYWTDKGTDAVILLAKKHLTGEYKKEFGNVFK